MIDVVRTIRLNLRDNLKQQCEMTAPYLRVITVRSEARYAGDAWRARRSADAHVKQHAAEFKHV